MRKVEGHAMKNIMARLRMTTEKPMLSSGRNIQSCFLRSHLIAWRALRRMCTPPALIVNMTQSQGTEGEGEDHLEAKEGHRAKDLGKRMVAVTVLVPLVVDLQVGDQEGKTAIIKLTFLKGKFL